MFEFGKQNRYCPNCGKHVYDSNLTMDHVQSMMCSDECRRQWEFKYAALILGKSAEPIK